MYPERKNGSGLRKSHEVRQIDPASVQIAPSDIARDINRDIILELIRFKQPLARADLARLSGLQPSTVSAIVEQLIREDWVAEGAVVKAARGRPSTMLSVNDAMATFALDLRPNRAILAVVDLSGRFLSRETIATYSDLNKTVMQIGQRIRALREAYSSLSFVGVGVSLQGRVNPVSQRVLLAPNMNWHEFDLKSALERVSGLQVEIDNDANACLMSELWFGRLSGVRDVVLVAVGEGIGTAILADGHMHAGSNGLAGEFGHISVDPAGPMCQCGQRGCWEMVASSRAALRTFNASSEHRVKDIYDLLQLVQDDEPNAVQALTEQAIELGRGLRMITAALSPELILVVGDITVVWERFGPIVARELAASMLAGPPPMLRATGDAELARLSGGAAMLMQRHASYHRSTHKGAAVKHS